MEAYETTGATTLYTQQMRVVSQPLEQIVGKGHNAKHVKDCTELHLGNKGIEQLGGFERLVNLEVLWLNDNKLSALNGLDSNIRIKQLYVHNNSICTLKGSLPKLKFLTNLDLSNNQLRDLGKLLTTLEKMRFIQELNVQGNPCCEELGYRPLLIHAMPSLKVLDHHQVSTPDRLQAAACIGGDKHILNVAFGAGVPASILQHRTAAAPCQQQTRSVLKQELVKMAESIRQKQQQAAKAAEAAQYAANPDAEYWIHHSSFPPPPGLLKAQQAWAAATAAHSTTAATTANNSISTSTTAAHHMGSTCGPRQGTAASVGSSSANTDVLLLTGSSWALKVLQGGMLMSSDALAAAARTYKPKDALVLHKLRKCSDTAGNTGADSSLVTGASSSKVKARYLEATFGHHLTDRKWEVEKNSLKL